MKAIDLMYDAALVSSGFTVSLYVQSISTLVSFSFFKLRLVKHWLLFLNTYSPRIQQSSAERYMR